MGDRSRALVVSEGEVISILPALLQRYGTKLALQRLVDSSNSYPCKALG